MVSDIGFGRQYRRPIGEVLRPDEESREVLDQLRRDMGPHKFATQYLQQPSALEGNVIRTDAFARFDLSLFERHHFHRSCRAGIWLPARMPGPTGRCA